MKMFTRSSGVLVELRVTWYGLFTGDEVSTYKINEENKESAWQLPSANGPGNQNGTRNGPQNRNVGIVVIKPFTHERDEKAVHH
jgi:hypothetical protein